MHPVEDPHDLPAGGVHFRCSQRKVNGGAKRTRRIARRLLPKKPTGFRVWISRQRECQHLAFNGDVITHSGWPVSFIDRLRQLRDDLLQTTDPSQREEILERMLFLVYAQAKSRAAQLAGPELQSAAALEPRTPAIGSPDAADTASAAPNGKTTPEDPV